MKKVLVAAVIAVLTTASESYGINIQPYAFLEHRDYTQGGKNIYSGAVEGIGADVSILNAGPVSITMNGKIYNGKLNARTTAAWIAHNEGGVLMPDRGLEEGIDKVNARGYASGINAAYPAVIGGFNLVPSLGIEYDKETLDGAKVKNPLDGWDWYDFWKSRAPSGSTTDRLSVRAALGIGKQINNDWGIGAGVILGIPISGKSKSDLGEIKNKGYDLDLRAGVSYKAWTLTGYYTYTKKNIACYADSDSFRVSSYGVSIGYTF